MMKLDEIPMFLKALGYSNCIQEVVEIEISLRNQDPQSSFYDLFDAKCQEVVEMTISKFHDGGEADLNGEYEAIRTMIYTSMVDRARRVEERGIDRVRVIAEMLSRGWGGLEIGFAKYVEVEAYTHCFEIAFPPDA